MKYHIVTKTNIIFVLAVLAVSAVAFGMIWLHYRHEPVESIEQPEKPVAIPAVKVISKTLFREDQLPGEINAYQDVLIYPKVPGFVKWIGVDRGSVVKEGQLMGRMYA